MEARMDESENAKMAERTNERIEEWKHERTKEIVNDPRKRRLIPPPPNPTLISWKLKPPNTHSFRTSIQISAEKRNTLQRKATSHPFPHPLVSKERYSPHHHTCFASQFLYSPRKKILQSRSRARTHPITLIS